MMTVSNKHKSFSRPFSQHQEHNPSGAADALITVLVGPSKKRFKVDKHLLISSSPFFASQLAEASRRSHSLNLAKPKPVALWLPLEDPTTFSLFVEWLSSRACFPSRVNNAISTAQLGGGEAIKRLHRGIVHLHLLAANLSLWQLQDMAMDAIQDMYRRGGWDVAPEFVDWLYDAEDDAAVRIKRWAVAMMAFAIGTGSNRQHQQETRAMQHHQFASLQDQQLTGPPNVAGFRQLLDKHSELSEDYAIHLRKMRASRLAIRWKDPRVRIDANKLQNEERAYGFRKCSFHSHRGAVGEDRCPHTVMGWALSTTDGESEYSQPSVEGEKVEEDADRPLGGLTAPRWSQRKEKNTMAVHVSELGSELADAKSDEDAKEQAKKVEDGKSRHDASRRTFVVQEEVVPPWPLFSRGRERERRAEEQTLKHMRSISSVLA